MDPLLQKARLEVPLSDEEIEQLYRDATGLGSNAKLSLVGPTTTVFVTTSIIGLCAYTIFVSGESQSPVVFALLVSAVCLGLGVVELTGRMGKRRKRDKIDPYSVSVLSTISEYLASESLSKADDLCFTIQMARERIKLSLETLALVIEQLQRELDATTDESVRLLVNSRLTSASETREKLQKNDAFLHGQRNEAMSAVAPVRELVGKIKRLTTLSGTLEEIQAAHGLVESTSDAIEYHAVELRLLHSLTAQATARLNDLRERLDASTLAHLEVENLGDREALVQVTNRTRT